MLVDDDDMFHIALTVLVRKSFSSELISAGNPKEAFDILEKEIPDLIILDMFMPVMDGNLMLYHLSKNPKTKDIPVIGCSAMDKKDYIDSLFAMGMNDYITKPIKTKILLDKMYKLLV